MDVAAERERFCLKIDYSVNSSPGFGPKISFRTEPETTDTAFQTMTYYNLQYSQQARPSSGYLGRSRSRLDRVIRLYRPHPGYSDYSGHGPGYSGYSVQARRVKFSVVCIRYWPQLDDAYMYIY